MFQPKPSRKFFPIHPIQIGLIGLVAVVFFFYNNCSQGLKVVAGSGSSAGAVSYSATNTVGQPFPRLGSYFIGGQPGSSYTLAWANYLALFNVNIIGGYTGTGAGMYGGSRKSFVAEILALTPANVGSQVFQYYIVDSGDPSSKSFDGLQYGLWNLTATNPNWWACRGTKSISDFLAK